MENLRKPHWILLLNTAPLLLLLALSYGEFAVIRSLLPAGSVVQWQVFGLALGGLGVGAGAYAAVQLARRQHIGILYSLVAMLVFSLWLCGLTVSADELLPRDVPGWMVPTNPILMAWTLLMPTLAHALLALVLRFTPPDRPHRALLNFGLAVAVPAGWAFVFGVWEVLTGWVPWPRLGWLDSFVWAGTATALVVTTFSFFFFLVRGVYILSLGRGGFWTRNGWVVRAMITLVLPIIGLGVNDGWILGNKFASTGGGIFGDFSSPWVIVLTVANFALLSLPDSPRPLLRLAQLLGRSVLFGYTFYFFLVFLPFLPLSIPAVILIGVGFLILAPTLLFVLHVRQLGVDVAALQLTYKKPLVLSVLLLGLATLPLALTAEYWHRRQVLHAALAYVYTPNYARTERLDAAALGRTLAVVRRHKDTNRELFWGHQQPYLSAYFNWLVLDNLMLSEAKIAALEQVFLGQARPSEFSNRWGAPTPLPAAALRRLQARSTYDARQQAWVSWVDMEVANPANSLVTQTSEYSTRFELPVGAWVGDYYLTINGRPEQGILSEKKAATWVYAQILNEGRNRDPSLFSYVGPREVALRVFPVQGQGLRRVRFQLLHKEPGKLTIDGQRLTLGQPAATPTAAPAAAPDPHVQYLSARQKQQLPLVQRRPYYHFLVDASAEQAARLPQYQARVRQQLAQALPNAAPVRVSLVSAYSQPVALNADWTQTPPEGGFYLTGAIRRALFYQQQATPTYPVFVVVTDSLDRAVLDDDFADLSSAYPESDRFYVLGRSGQLEPHSLRRQARQPLAETPAPGQPVLMRAWPTADKPVAYLPDNQQADLVLRGRPEVPGTAAAARNRWRTGLLLHGYSQWQAFHPAAADQERLPFLQASFRTGIMTPATAYLALENEAQKAALRRKQTQVLAANSALDLDEGQQKPTEVPIDGSSGLLLLGGALLAARQLRRRHGPLSF